MKIGLDMDGVLHDWDWQAIEFLNRRRFLAEQLIYPSSSWDYIENSIKPNEWESLWDPENVDDLFDGREFPATRSALEILSQIGDIVIITSRPQYASSTTISWLGRKDVPISAIHVIGRGEKKSDYTKCDIFLDDRPSNVEDLTRNGTPAYLWSRPHNKDFKWDKRITKWANFIGKCLEVRDGRG